MSLGLESLGLESLGLDAVASSGGGSSHLVTVANSQQVNTASTAAIQQSGNGTITHLAAEYFVRQAGVQAVHAPYRGSGQALSDVAEWLKFKAEDLNETGRLDSLLSLLSEVIKDGSFLKELEIYRAKAAQPTVKE